MSIVVTGATGTMTAFYVQKLAERQRDSRLVMFVRRPDSIASPLPPSSSAQVEYRQLELKDLAAVRKAGQQLAEDVKAGKVPPIKALVLSAAIQHVDPAQPHFTEDGYEETMAVCHLAHYILLRELVGSLGTKGARVIILGSSAHSPTYAFFPRKTDWKPLDELLHPDPHSDPPKESMDYGKQRYGNAKLAQLARRLAADPTYKQASVLMFNPGSMGGTGLFRSYPYVARKIIGASLYFTTLVNFLTPGAEASRPSASANTLLKLTLDPAYGSAGKKPIGALKGVGGASYYDPWGKEIETEGWALDVSDCKQLWVESARVLGYPEELSSS